MYQIAKGVFDILPSDPQQTWRESHLWQFLEQEIRKLTLLYGYREIRTPLFESTALFQRSIGKETDIVTKEMYTFEDQGKRSITLRPEGTAPVMRAFIEKNLAQANPIHKFFYLAPMFRYERQQAGRYRQHHQFGIEAIGNGSPYQDAEVIHLFFTFLSNLGLKNLTLQINSIGCLGARKAFRQALKEYLTPHLKELSADSQRRFETNPLRILDSKDPKDQAALENAPSILDYLSEESKTHFEHVLALLDVPFQINPRLVRGLDYYNNTVFEVTADELGAQNSLGGGGRYDGLIRELGGPDLPAFGFGCGLERVIQTLIGQSAPLPERPVSKLLLIPLGEKAMATCFEQLCILRKKGIAAEMDFSGKKLKNAMRFANASGVEFVAIIGENELEKKQVELKEMATGESETLAFDQLEKRLRAC